MSLGIACQNSETHRSPNHEQLVPARIIFPTLQDSSGKSASFAPHRNVLFLPSFSGECNRTLPLALSKSPEQGPTEKSKARTSQELLIPE